MCFFFTVIVLCTLWIRVSQRVYVYGIYMDCRVITIQSFNFYCQLQNSSTLSWCVCVEWRKFCLYANDTFFLFIYSSFSLIFSSIVCASVYIHEANTVNNQFIVCDMREVCLNLCVYTCNPNPLWHSSDDHYEEIHSLIYFDDVSIYTQQQSVCALRIIHTELVIIFENN